MLVDLLSLNVPRNTRTEHNIEQSLQVKPMIMAIVQMPLGILRHRLKRLRYSLSIGSIALTFFAQGQINTYATFADLENENPKSYPRHVFDRFKGRERIKMVLRDTITDEKLELDCSTLWGFSFKGGLYRVVRQGTYYRGEQYFPVRLHEWDGGLFFWVNAKFLENTVERFRQWHVPALGPWSGFLSLGMDGDLVGALDGTDPKLDEEAFRNADLFFQDFPEHLWLKECVRVRIAQGFRSDIAMHCLQQRKVSDGEK